MQYNHIYRNAPNAIVFPLHPSVLVDAAFFLAILLYSLVRPIHLAAWWYPFLFYIQVYKCMYTLYAITYKITVIKQAVDIYMAHTFPFEGA